MTKQIIDGVDVSGCEYCGYDNVCRLSDYIVDCEDNPNCYYKQLKRKEQECDMWKNLTVDNGAVALMYQQQLDQLKEELAISIQENEEGREINAELKAENDELKKIINEAKNSKLDLKSFLVGEAIQNEYEQQLDQLKEQLNAKEQECEKLKEDLIEAKAHRDYLNNLALSVSLNLVSEQLDQLKAENEDLQEQIRKHNDDMFKNPPEKRFYCKGCTLPYISKKLKQTLTEIKEICNNNDELKGDFNLVDCDKYKLGKHNLANRILQKISEVENG